MSVFLGDILNGIKTPEKTGKRRDVVPSFSPTLKFIAFCVAAPITLARSKRKNKWMQKLDFEFRKLDKIDLSVAEWLYCKCPHALYPYLEFISKNDYLRKGVKINTPKVYNEILEVYGDNRYANDKGRLQSFFYVMKK